MLYGWLVDERMTIRQILKRLNFGPWFPRCGRRPWSPSVVHHILSEPVYTGTAYANRYEYRAVAQAALAQAGLRAARAAAGCGRASSGSRSRSRRSSTRTSGTAPRRSWRATPRCRSGTTEAQPPAALPADLRRLRSGHARGPRRTAAERQSGALPLRRQGPRDDRPGERLPARAGRRRRSWRRPSGTHVRGLLADPDRLLAQFERFAAGAGPEAQRATRAERQLRARLDRLARADRRLVDAYQAEVISLEELPSGAARWLSSGTPSSGSIERQPQLRGEQVKAQAVLSGPDRLLRTGPRPARRGELRRQANDLAARHRAHHRSRRAAWRSAMSSRCTAHRRGVRAPPSRNGRLRSDRAFHAQRHGPCRQTGKAPLRRLHRHRLRPGHGRGRQGPVAPSRRPDPHKGPQTGGPSRRSGNRCAGLHDLPKEHRVKIHSTNPIERLNGEIKRRTDVVGIFPNEEAITRLIGASLLEQNDEWAVQRARYMTLETIAPLGDDTPIMLRAMEA